MHKGKDCRKQAVAESSGGNKGKDQPKPQVAAASSYTTAGAGNSGAVAGTMRTVGAETFEELSDEPSHEDAMVNEEDSFWS